MPVDGKFSLKELRARKGVSQQQAARDLGVTPQTYCAWEKDVSNVRISMVERIADYYGVKIGDILFYARQHENNSSTEPQEVA